MPYLLSWFLWFLFLTEQRNNIYSFNLKRMRLSEKSFTGCAVQGITSFRQSAGGHRKKDDILAIFVATLRDSYESLFPD